MKRMRFPVLGRLAAGAALPVGGGCAPGYLTLRREAAMTLGCPRPALRIPKLSAASAHGAETACVGGCGIAARYTLSCISRTGLGGCRWALIERFALEPGRSPPPSCCPRAPRPR